MTLSDLKTLGFYTTSVEGADDLNYQLNIETRREDQSTLKEQVLSSYLLPRQIKLKGIVKGSSSADLVSKLGTLQSTLSAGIVSFEYEGGSISCYLDGGVSWKKIGPEFGTLIAECEISLREIGTADSSPVARTLKHYRGVTYKSTLKPISGHIRETFMGRKELELTLENQDIRNLDVIRVYDGVSTEYYTVQIPEPERRDNAKFITITAEHAYYGFGNRMFLDNSTEEEVFEYFGIDLSTLLGYLFTGSGVSKNTTNLNAGTLSEVQEISFSSQTRLNALQAICEKWGIEYKFSANGTTCYLGEKGSLGDTTGAMIEYSKNLKGVKKRIDTRGLVTRLRPVGSSENLPTWYVYQNLRITTLVPNGTGGYDHSGDLFIDNNTATYGIIERRMDFDVKVQAKHGSVTGVGTGSIEGYDGTYPYIVDSARTEATGALNGGTLHVADGPDVGEAKILYYDGSTKRIYYRIDSDENFDFTPSAGAFYKITDIELTYQEINEAAATLLAKAQDYLDTASEPQVSYEVDFAQLWERDKVSYSTDYFEVGDMITVKDTDLGINDSLRVITKEIDVVRPWKVKIEVSNKVQQIEDIILDIIEEGNTLKKKERVLTINQKRHNDAVRALQLLKNNNFFGSDVEINGGNIKAGTIEAEAIAIGSGNRNFQLWGVSFEPNYDDSYAKFHATGGALVFYGEEDVWTLNANTVTGLTQDTTYLVYVRLRKGNLTSADNAIILSSDTKEAEDATYYYYHVGFLEVGNSTTASFLATSYGWTIIHGSQIQTGTIYADYIRVGSPADTQIGLIDTKAQDALDAAQAAEEDAAEALAEVNEITDDSILKGGTEKSQIRKEWDSIAKEYFKITVQAIAYSLSGDSAYTAYYNATAALWTYLNGGSGAFSSSTPPAWISDANLGTDTDIVPATFRSKFADYYDTRQGILNKFVGYAKGLADAAQAAANAAQADADAALDEISEIVDDGILKGGTEKSSVRKEWDSIVKEYKQIQAQATLFEATTETAYTDYVAKAQALWTYLNNGSGTFNIDTVPLWISDAQLGNDTDIVSATFRSKFADYYDKRQAVLNLFAKIANDNALAANALAQSAKDAADAAQEDADEALEEIADIVSDSILKGGAEKSKVRQEWDSIVVEYKELHSQTDDFDLLSDSHWTNYYAATESLWTYLNGGSGTFHIDTVPLWISDAQLGNDTEIVPATFRSKFSGYYEKRQSLLNKFVIFFAENVGVGYTEIDGGKITSFIISALKYIQAGGDSENYRLNSSGLEYRRLITARINDIRAFAQCDATSSAKIEVWYRWTENYSDASPDWSSWQNPDDLTFSSSFQWYIEPSDPIYGADMTDFAMQFKFVLYSTALVKPALGKWNVYINNEFALELDSTSDFQDNADASTSGITYGSGLIEPTNYSSTGTYITKASSVVESVTPELDISKIMHTIHSGTVVFDGSTDNMIQTIWHNKHLQEERFEVKLEALEEQRWKSTFDTSTDYFFQKYLKKIVDSSGISDAIEIGFYATEGVLSQNLGSADATDDSGWKLIKSVTSISKIEFDVYHYGAIHILKEHVVYHYDSAYTGKVLTRKVDNDLEICFDGDYSEEKTIEGVVGGVNIENVVVWTEGTKIALKGTFRYELQLQR